MNLLNAAFFVALFGFICCLFGCFQTFTTGEVSLFTTAGLSAVCVSNMMTVRGQSQ